MIVPYYGRQPAKKTPGAAAYDFKANKTRWLWPFVPTYVGLGTRQKLPPNMAMLLLPRSSLSIGNGWLAHIGLIDSDYHDEIMFLVVNLLPWPRKIRAGDRVAQGLYINRYDIGYQVQSWYRFTTTASRRGGFGSTGRR